MLDGLWKGEQYGAQEIDVNENFSLYHRAHEGKATARMDLSASGDCDELQRPVRIRLLRRGGAGNTGTATERANGIQKTDNSANEPGGP
ncbi:hypothetical protein MicB006_5741 [Micromonospora sp. B006]|nr:hypothetical protein MicB006_5741 [Micromonospora sp. B006]